MIQKLIDGIFKLALFHFTHHKMLQKWPPQHEWHNMYLFRSAICEYLILLDWITQGGAKGVKSETLRNDVVDMHLVVCATFFDGLLSADAKALWLYEGAKLIIRYFENHVDSVVSQR